jgi:hypothetical protein
MRLTLLQWALALVAEKHGDVLLHHLQRVANAGGPETLLVLSIELQISPVIMRASAIPEGDECTAAHRREPADLRYGAPEPALRQATCSLP